MLLVWIGCTSICLPTVISIGAFAQQEKISVGLRYTVCII